MTSLSITGILLVQEGIAGLVLLILTLLISARYGFWIGLAAALTCNVILIFFFLEPLFVFWADDPQELISLPVFWFASLIGASILQASQALTEEAQRGQAQSDALLELNRAISAHHDPHESLASLCRQVVATFGVGGASVLTRETGGWEVIAAAGDLAVPELTGDEALLAGLAINGGISTGSHPAVATTSEGVFVPLVAAGSSLGVLRIEGPRVAGLLSNGSEALLMAYAREGALAISRIQVASVAGQAESLRRADEMKAALLKAISHELKTPLASIKTSTSSLLDRRIGWTQEDQSDFLGTILAETERLDKTIDELLALSRIEAGAVQPLLDCVPMAHIVEDAIELKGMLLRDRDIEVSVGDVSVHTDPSLMRQAIANLLENAALHSRPGGGIRVSSRQGAGTLQLTIEDDGPGVATDELPYIFNPFYRARNGRALPHGSGLGLAIVKGFVDLCGGSVSAESSPVATRFVIELPLMAAGTGV